MTVSAITQIVKENFVAGLAAFVSGGVPFVAWTTPTVIPGLFQLWWRRHDGADGTETLADFNDPYFHFSAVIRTSDGALLFVYDDGYADLVEIWATAFNSTTGALVMPPVLIATGSRPSIVNLPSAAAGRVTIMFERFGAIYICESFNGGATWGNQHPVLNNKVNETVELAVVPFDESHLSIVQVGRDARTLRELGSLTRTRPMAGIVAHPTLADRFYVVESTQRSVAAVDQFTDLQRDGIVLKPNGDLIVPDRVRQGTDDSLGELLLLNTSGVAPVVVDSVVIPAGATPGADIVNVAAGPPMAAGTGKDTIFGASNAGVADADFSATLGYFVGYTDQATTGGLAVYDPATDTIALPLSGCSARAVSVCSSFTPAVIAVATAEAGQEKLRIYTENGLTPTLRATHKLPARANFIRVVMDTATVGRIYCSLADRLLVYQVSGLTNPIRLVLSIPILTRGNFFHAVLTARGNLIVAAGNGGVAVFAPSGETLAQTVLSGVYAPEWQPSHSYGSGEFVTPTAMNAYAPQRRYFRCMVAGVSGVFEPPWAPTGSVADEGATWVEQGILDPVVAGVAIDNTRQRIYAVGTIGGPTGTQGRVYVLDARGLL
jgi:hypothetical protein